MREMKKYHLAHHYKNFELGFGVTSEHYPFRFSSAECMLTNSLQAKFGTSSSTPYSRSKHRAPEYCVLVRRSKLLSVSPGGLLVHHYRHHLLALFCFVRVVYVVARNMHFLLFVWIIEYIRTSPKYRDLTVIMLAVEVVAILRRGAVRKGGVRPLTFASFASCLPLPVSFLPTFHLHFLQPYMVARFTDAVMNKFNSQDNHLSRK
jgi:hypothetical protein